MQDVSLRRLCQAIAVTLVAGIALIVVVAFVIMPFAKSVDKMAYLDILVEPSSAKVEIAGNEYRNAVYEAEPGTYTVAVTGPGMEPVNYTVELRQNETTGLYLRLMDGGQWKQDSIEELTERNAIGRKLPMYFSICGIPAKRTNCDAISVDYDRVEECDYDLCLIISGRKDELSDDVLAETKKQLSDIGYDLDDYQYIYMQNDDR